MLNDDGSFEIEMAEGGVQGIFLPTVTIVKGRLSPAALKHFQTIQKYASSERFEVKLMAAIKSRWLKVGRRGGGIVVKTNDFV